MLLVPFACMPFAASNEALENKELAQAPSLIEDGRFNVNVLPESGDYFNDHFAFRPYILDANARLYASLFDVSTVNTVIKGSDDWLYYAGTLNDYQNRSPLREREAFNIAHNMRMFQDWCEAQGADFAFTVAPDKNALYPEDMPAYYPQVDNESMAVLKGYLDSEEVNYIDMFELFGNDEEAKGAVHAAGSDLEARQYFLRDSHWTERGALIGHDAIADALGIVSAGIDQDEMFVRDDYIGDLNKMLYPTSAVPEDDWYVKGVNDGSGETHALRSGEYWSFVQGSDTNDDIVETKPTAASPYQAVSSKNGSLLMFRDSFAMGLIPYFSVEYESCNFDKLIPYNGLRLLDEEYRSVVVERAERHVADLAEKPFIMPCPTAGLPAEIRDAPSQVEFTCDVEATGTLTSVRGEISGLDLDANARIYVSITDEDGETRTYEAFGLSGESGNDNGYAVYVGTDTWTDKNVEVGIFAEDGASCIRVGSCDRIM